MAQHTVYAVASGKGGVGKTATTVNLGAALAEAGHAVAIVDADLGMANLGGFLGLGDEDVTLHEVLAGAADLEEAVYEVADNLAVVPSGISLEGFASVETEALSDAVAALQGKFDYVILDLGAGLSHDTVLPLALSDAVILVSTPDRLALQDTAKTREITRRLGGAVGGVVLTRAVEPKGLDLDAISEQLDLPVLAVIPEDPGIRESADAGRPVVGHDPEGVAADGYRGLADIVVEESLANAPFIPDLPGPIERPSAAAEADGLAGADADADAAPADADAEVDDAPTDAATSGEAGVSGADVAADAADGDVDAGAADADAAATASNDPDAGTAAGAGEPPPEPGEETAADAADEPAGTPEDATAPAAGEPADAVEDAPSPSVSAEEIAAAIDAASRTGAGGREAAGDDADTAADTGAEAAPAAGDGTAGDGEAGNGAAGDGAAAAGEAADDAAESGDAISFEDSPETSAIDISGGSGLRFEASADDGDEAAAGGSGADDGGVGFDLAEAVDAEPSSAAEAPPDDDEPADEAEADGAAFRVEGAEPDGEDDADEPKGGFLSRLFG